MIAKWTALNRFEDLALVNYNAKISGSFVSTKNALHENIFIAHASMDFVVSSFHFFLSLFYYRFMLWYTFDATLSSLTEQVDFALLLFLLPLPNTTFFTFKHEENPIFYSYYCPKIF